MIVGGGDNIRYEETTWGRQARLGDHGDDACMSPGVELVEIG